MNWLETLSDKQKESVFAAMIKIGDRALVAMRKEREFIVPYGSVLVGNRAFDWFLRHEILRDFVQALRDGKTPEEAEGRAKWLSRKLITNNNAKNPEPSWQRWEGAGDSFIEWSRRLIESACASSI